RMRASSPVWLAEELTRSWRVQWPELPDAMEEAAASRMRASSPVWLAEELTRSWRVQWPELPDAMEEA
ncbi:hypothetical protein BVW01_23550, partial [Mycobacterium tuberculosis]